MTDFIADLQRTLKKMTNNRSHSHLKVQFREVVKNNDTQLHACMISLKESSGIVVAPTLYLEDFYDSYRKGMSMTRLAKQILEIAEQYLETPILPSFQLEDYESMKKSLCVQIVSAERNREILQHILYRPLEDLAIVPMFLVDDPRMGQGCVKVQREYARSLGISEEQIMEEALSNAPDLLPAIFCNLEEILEELRKGNSGEEIPGLAEREIYSGSLRDFGVLKEEEEEEEPTTYLLSNHHLTYGASVIAYPDVAEKVWERIGADYFLLPSSINEWIVLRDFGQDPEDYKKMVQDINRTQVAPQEILSDSIYHYRRGSGQIVRVC